MIHVGERFNRLALEHVCRSNLVNYWDNIQSQGFIIPDSKALRYLSVQIDLAAKKAFEDLVTVLRSSPEHEQRIYELNRQPTTVGRSSLSKLILRDTSSFEQMVALSDWLGRKTITTTHTFVFAYKQNDYIPVKATSSNLLHVVLGATKGTHKLPKYSAFAENDPWIDANHQRFIYPLESLEIARQPNFIAATILKGNAFESEYIDQQWRYGLDKACVESPGQSKDSPQKLTSAGLNLTALAENFGANPHVNLIDHACFENYLDDGYRDDEDPKVSLRSILTAARDAFYNTDTIDRLMKILLVSKIGPTTTPRLREYIVNQIW